MSLSIQTNIASLTAQNNIRANSAFQANTITQLQQIKGGRWVVIKEGLAF